MGQYFVRLFEGDKKWRLSLLITSPKCSARAVDAAGPLKEGDVIHLLQADNWLPGGKHMAMRFTVLSIDLLNKKYWGPYLGGSQWNPILESYQVSDLIHIHGFCKVVMGDPDLKDNTHWQTNFTKFISGLPYKEWQVVWEVLNNLRTERIDNRIANPRKERGQKFNDDYVDIFLSRLISRVNAILNQQLYWGNPAADNYYLIFSKDMEVLETSDEE